MGRAEIVKKAQSWLGCKESDGSFQEIIDVYNTIKPLPRGYKMTYADPWCAAFVSAVYQSTDSILAISPECSCTMMMRGMKGMGQWFSRDNYVPKEGDLVFYDWDGGGNPDHVGIVENVLGSMVQVIEGNRSDDVSRRIVALGDKMVLGFGVPNFPDEPPLTISAKTVPDLLRQLADMIEHGD